jgi:hypothetical protein
VFGWLRGTNLPPLVTTSPTGTARASAGILGSPTTSVLYSGLVDDDLRSGFHLGMGYRFDRGLDINLGLEVGFTVLESQSSIFDASSNGTPILARPFFNAASNNAPQSVLIAFPGSSSGALDVRASSGSFYDVNLDLTQNVCDTGWFRLEALMGYRFYRYDEGLRITQVINPTNGVFVAGTQIGTIDDFATHNEFHGGELGARVEFRWENLTLGALGKFGVGYLSREVSINGGQKISIPGTAPTLQSGGVYALSSNIGLHTQSDATVLPEIGLNVAWQINSNLRLRLGYSALLLDRIVHAADQIDLTVNPNLFPGSTTTGGPNRPAFSLNRTDSWVQTINLGAEFTY